MALTATEQKLFDLALGNLPEWFADDDRSMEFLGAAAKLMGAAHAQTEDWVKNTLIGTAVGPTATDPAWLAQHAVDRNSTRQNAETDVALRDRLRNIPDAVTLPALQSAAQSIVDGQGIVGTVVIFELPEGGSFLGVSVSDAGTGGAFENPVTGPQFVPDVLPRAPQLLIGNRLVIAGAADAGNNGTFVITGLNENGIQYVNGSFVAAVDAGATWTHVKHNPVNDQVCDGFARAYCSRGYRTTSTAIVAILPFGCTASTEGSIREMLRQKKGAGVAAIVECRTAP